VKGHGGAITPVTSPSPTPALLISSSDQRREAPPSYCWMLQEPDERIAQTTLIHNHTLPWPHFCPIFLVVLSFPSCQSCHDDLSSVYDS